MPTAPSLLEERSGATGSANGSTLTARVEVPSVATPSATALSATAPDIVRPSVTKLKPYVPGKPIEEVKRELGLPEDFTIYKLASNENVLGPSPHAIEAINRVAGETWLYPDDTCFDLKNALASFWNLSPDHFIVGNGSDEIIHFLSLALLDGDDEVIFADPSFVQYKAAAMMADCAFRAVPLTADMRHDLKAMRAAVNERTKLIFIANPNNPTGTVVTRQEFEALLDGLPPRAVVVLDQAYLEYVEDMNSPRGIEYIHEHNVVVLQTFSKAYALAGLRCGYGIARPELTGYLQQVRGPFNVNMLAQAAAIASLQDTAQVDRAQSVNREGKNYFYTSFDEMGLTYAPTEANFVLVDTGLPSKDVFQELLKRGVIVRTGDPFGMPTWLRVTIGTPEMNERFISSLRAILSG
ncbi:MAG: histidinol-phosphate aminotransferase [Abditibacteriota bacterium]|nr:histidinol-phosphate aminotransferase [Abditibacteriota bacterium]